MPAPPKFCNKKINELLTQFTNIFYIHSYDSNPEITLEFPVSEILLVGRSPPWKPGRVGAVIPVAVASSDVPDVIPVAVVSLDEPEVW